LHVADAENFALQTNARLLGEIHGAFWDAHTRVKGIQVAEGMGWVGSVGGQGLYLG
jgi:hypothetical protein